MSVDENSRVKEIRLCQRDAKTLEKFSKRLGVSASAISQIESGKCSVTTQMRTAICREFNISEAWLRTGEGDMHPPESRDQTISRFLGDLLHDQPDFRHRLITALATMTVDEWELLERKIREIAEEKPDP